LASNLLRINAVRLILPNFWFGQAKCADGLMALRRCRCGPPALDQRGNAIPRCGALHDASSNGAEAFRTFAVAAKSPVG
jgi:hypothetical protein